MNARDRRVLGFELVALIHAEHINDRDAMHIIHKLGDEQLEGEYELNYLLLMKFNEIEEIASKKARWTDDGFYRDTTPYLKEKHRLTAELIQEVMEEDKWFGNLLVDFIQQVVGEQYEKIS